MKSIYSIIILTGLTVMTVCAEDWPQFRGPGGEGHSVANNLPTTWSKTANVLWRTEIPGRGWSSPVIKGEQIWMTTAFETEAGEEEIKERLKANTGSQPLTVLSEVRLHAICVDKSTGKILKNVELLVKRDPQWVHKLNSYASPTPILEDGRLYCHFGAYGDACVDTDSGAVLWTNTTLRIMHENGPGGSPVLSGDHMIIHCDGSDVQFIAALDKKTGAVAWKTDRSGALRGNAQLRKAYCTPLVVDFKGKPQVVSPGADWLYGYDPANGRELWKLSYGVLGFSNVARPVTAHGMVYICTCFMQSELLAVRYDGADGNPEPHIVWRYKKGVARQSSPIVVGDEIYFVSDTGGIVTCLDAHTGKELWKERIDGDHSASPLYADGKLYFFSQDGNVAVLQPGREFKVLAASKIDERYMASPAAVDNALYLRTDKALYRIQNAGVAGDRASLQSN